MATKWQQQQKQQWFAGRTHRQRVLVVVAENLVEYVGENVDVALLEDERRTQANRPLAITTQQHAWTRRGKFVTLIAVHR